MDEKKVELDDETKANLEDAISKAVSSQLGNVKIYSVHPAPRNSLRVAAQVTSKYGKAGIYASGIVSLLGSILVLFRPEYAAPIAQAIKIIGAVIGAVGGGTPSPDIPSH